jgi:hypothetical protein
MSAVEMSALELAVPVLRAATAAELQVIDELRLAMERCPQIDMPTEHILHGGMYARSIRMAPGDVVLGALILVPTLIVLNGSVSVLVGNRAVDYQGYNVIPGAAGRQSMFFAHSSLELTMIYPTRAKTVDEAEEEIFNQPDMLVSRKAGSEETVLITGQ